MKAGTKKPSKRHSEARSAKVAHGGVKGKLIKRGVLASKLREAEKLSQVTVYPAHRVELLVPRRVPLTRHELMEDDCEDQRPWMNW